MTLVDMSKVFTLQWAQNHTVVPSMVCIVPANNFSEDGVTNTALIVVTMPGKLDEDRLQEMDGDELAEDIQSRSLSFLIPMETLMVMVDDVKSWPAHKTGMVGS